MHVHHKRLLIRIQFDANGGHVAVRDNLAHPPQSLFRWSLLTIETHVKEIDMRRCEERAG